MLIGSRRANLLGGVVGVGFAFVVGQAGADEPLSPGTATSAGAAFGDAVDAAELARHRAGEFDVISTIVGNQTQHAENSGNAINADAVTSGSVFIDGEALKQMRGIGQIVANSGPQANVQGAISVYLILNPPPADP